MHWLTVKRDISFAIFEVANCFLDGAGVKKSPEVGVAYLRFAAKLGDIQSQERRST
jgi:TPR repeat protein